MPPRRGYKRKRGAANDSYKITKYRRTGGRSMTGTYGVRYGTLRNQKAAAVANLRTGGFLGLELKFLDCAWNTVTINTSTDGSSGEVQPSSGCTGCISVPAQGDTESSRDGRKYTIKSVYLTGVINSTALTDQADAADDFGVFAALVLDTQANGATLVSENVYINPGTSSFCILPQPLRNLQNSKRYRILASKYIRPGGLFGFNDNAGTAAFTGTVSAMVAPTVTLSWKGNIVCDSTGTTANVSSASDNAIHLLMFSGGGHTKQFIGKSRVRFLG